MRPLRPRRALTPISLPVSEKSDGMWVWPKKVTGTSWTEKISKASRSEPADA